MENFHYNLTNLLNTVLKDFFYIYHNLKTNLNNKLFNVNKINHFKLKTVR